MKDMIQRFPEQLKEALVVSKDHNITPSDTTIHNVLICGMGGSAIGANFVQAFADKSCSIPIVVNKGYQIPGWVGERTLVICSSYSGNTEETLSCFEQALSKHAQIVAIASGGKIIEAATEKGLNYLKVPGGWSSPRACLGFSLVAQLTVLATKGLIDEQPLQQVEQAIELIEKEVEDIQQRAEHVAQYLNGKTPVVYCMDSIEPVALRFRQQLNENSKILCWHHVIPEMNHNELVGWYDQRPDIAVVILRNRDDYARNQMRLDISKEIMGDRSSTLIELYSKGTNQVERCLYLVHLVDWISLYLAELRGVDPIQIKVIDYLKAELAKV